MRLNNCTCKLPVVGSEVVCILNSAWTNKEVKLLLIHDNQAWSGQVSGNEDVLELMDQLSLTEESYLEETRNALTTHGGALGFAYTIANDAFAWKKYVRTNMAVKFGFVTLSKVPVFDIFEKVIDSTLQSNIKISEELSKTEKQRVTLEEENLLLKTKLNELIEKKNEMETALYSQFVSVLNEKKKKIEELQNKVDSPDENESDMLQSSDSDHFGSDTELDSEQEEKQSPSKVDVVESKGSLDMEDENIYTLPKRSRQNKKDENIAGPSGCMRKNRNASVATNSKPKKSNDFSILPAREMGTRKFGRDSCVKEKITEEKEKSNSEEDVFRFPKRSRTINNGMKLVKPSSSKVEYDSDETCLDKTQEVEIDSDRTQDVEVDSDRTLSQIDVESIEKAVKVEKPDNNELKNNVIQANSSKIKRKNVNNDQNKRSKGKSEVNECASKEYSSSTLDMLNQLI